MEIRNLFGRFHVKTRGVGACRVGHDDEDKVRYA
jgi:hypothetical protein